MPLSLVRIDDRLVHGQVVQAWIPFLRAEAVVVVSEAVAADETQKALMLLALPEGVGFEALGVEEAVRHRALSVAYPKRVLLLAPGPQEVLALLERGARFESVNVGGLHYSAGKVQLGKAIFLGEDDRRALAEIHRRGVRLEGRALPGERQTDLLAAVGAGSSA